MYTALTIIHIIASLIMISVILLQAGKGAEIGATFGGSSQTLFGGRGAATFLSKLTVGAAIVFMLTTIGLAIISKGRSTSSSLIETKTPISSPAEKPVPSEVPRQESTPASPTTK